MKFTTKVKAVRAHSLGNLKVYNLIKFFLFASIPVKPNSCFSISMKDWLPLKA